MSDVFQNIFINNKANKTLALLHGTGGDENDLLPLVNGLSDHYNFLGIRGNVVQAGMNRFFLRNGDGSFDLENIREEAAQLREFLSVHPVEAYVGYSNGANMILALTFLYPALIDMAVILHGKVPFAPPAIKLAGKSFLLSYGENDQIISAAESTAAITTLQSLGARVTSVSHTGGHEIHANEIEAMEKFLRA